LVVRNPREWFRFRSSAGWLPLSLRAAGRLVLCGDRDQHSSPERGEAIRILQDSHSVRSVQLTETFRPQVPFLKETVLDLKAHWRKEGYERLDAHGDIIEIEDPFELREAAVDLHFEAARAGMFRESPAIWRKARPD
jgi:AAA domain